MDNVMTVSTREEWKKALGRLGFLKALGQVGLVGKEEGRISPFDVMNEWTLAFFTDDEGQRHVLELKE